jgi:hypothetical protein
MKKAYIYLTGIVFIITILIASGFTQAVDLDKLPEDLKKVEIFLKVYIKDGEKHLEMYDSNNPAKRVIDDLHTVVEPGTKVVWRRAKDSGIRSIKKVSPTDRGEIFTGDARTILLNKRFRTRIPEGQVKRDKEEKYIIVFLDKKDKEETPIDPYLRVRGAN